MRTIVHISDLHFGRINPHSLRPLLERIWSLNPSLVVVSGDLTQHAFAKEFREAKQFLMKLPEPQIIVPGNHDIPMFNLPVRLLMPMRRYRRHILYETEQFFTDGEIAIMGLNSARGVTIDNGKISRRQMQRVKSMMCNLGEDVTKILVLHHPIHQPMKRLEKKLVGRADTAMKAFAECGADLILSGHRHISYADHTSERYQIDGYAALVVLAATATSMRQRKNEGNAFNVLRIDRPLIHVDGYKLNEMENSFDLVKEEAFKHDINGWQRIELVKK